MRRLRQILWKKLPFKTTSVSGTRYQVGFKILYPYVNIQTELRKWFQTDGMIGLKQQKNLTLIAVN